MSSPARFEAWTGSHLYAAQYTYSHPLFTFILAMLFVNILVSALRRWPFKPKHIPFLITHLGLLMVLSGVMIKNQFGIQGVISVAEGAGNHQVLIPHTHAISIQDKTGNIYQYPHDKIENLKINVAGYAPHISEKWKSWIKGNVLVIAGLPLIPIQEWSFGTPWPEMSPVLLPADSQKWHVAAIRTKDQEEAIRRASHLIKDPFSFLAKIFKESLLYMHLPNKKTYSDKNSARTSSLLSLPMIMVFPVTAFRPRSLNHKLLKKN